MSINRSKERFTAGVAAAAVSLVAIPNAYALDFTVSGQVNRAVIAADNGEDSDIGFVDNHASPTRFAFGGSQDMDSGQTIGFNYEIALADDQSNKFDINQHDDSDFFENRLANVYIKGAFGKFTLGRQDGAANSTSKVDYSGLTDFGGGTPVGDYFGGLHILAGDGSDGAAISDVYNSFDALSRQDAIRYDTPSFGGLTFAASLDEGQAYEFAPRYETRFGKGVKFAAAADYVDSGHQDETITRDGHTEDGSSFKEYGGSASVLLASGLNFTGQYKRRSYDDTLYADGDRRDHAQTYFGGIGYIFGKNHVQALYGHTDDLYSKGSNADNYGVAYRYDLMKAVNLYGAYHHISANGLDLAGGHAQDINVVFTGVRVKFF